jgi:hypothetical protein
MNSSNSESLEDEVFRETFKWAIGRPAAERRGRSLTKEEQAYYDRIAEALAPVIQRILKS